MVMVSISPPGPGMNWGGRFLLSALPFWAILAARAWESNYEAVSGYGRVAVVASLVALAGVGVYANRAGFAAIHSQMADMSAHNARVLAIDSPAIANDNWLMGMGQVEAPKARMFLLDDVPNDAAPFLRLLNRLGIHEFVYIGSAENLKPLEAAARGQNPPFVVAGILREPAMGVRFVQPSPPPSSQGAASSAPTRERGRKGM
jgi:hypothetical protein